jgi:tetratricopeptide (TPR) repeat protein
MEVNMRKFLLVLICGVLFISCSRMTEKEVYDNAVMFGAKAEASPDSSEYYFKESLKYYEKLLKDFPTSPNHAKSLFMAGFVCANHLKNIDKAKRYYEEFLQKYPNHELSVSVKFELEHLGKDPAELPLLKEGEEEEKPKKEEEPKEEETSKKTVAI